MPVPDRDHGLALGRVEKSPTPALALRDVIDVDRAVSAMERHDFLHGSITMSWRVKQWPMYANDRIGDCTCASAGHAKHVAAVYGADPFTVTEQEVIAMYSAVTGYDPVTGQNDNGAYLKDVAGYLRTHGIQGTPDIAAYANVDVADRDACQVAHWLFGGLYCGADLPLYAQAQYHNGQHWTYATETGPNHDPNTDPGSWGGHCMLRVNSRLGKTVTFVTWGGLQVASQDWWDAYVDEAFAFVPTGWQDRMPPYLAKHNLVDWSKLNSFLHQLPVH